MFKVFLLTFSPFPSLDGYAWVDIYNMAELHIIGQIVGGSGFTESSLFCTWPFTQEQHDVFCRGLEGVRPRWTSPRGERWRPRVTWLTWTTPPRTYTAGPNSISKCRTKTPLDQVKYMVTGIAMSPPALDITASVVQPGGRLALG